MLWMPLLCWVAFWHAEVAEAQRIDVLGPQVRKYVQVSSPKAVLEHVQVIDGTGAPPSPDQNIYIEDGKISAISPGADLPSSEGTTIIDLQGYSVMPGIIGMHDPLYYLARPNLAADRSFEAPALFLPMSFSAPRLYLANGVTTIRTAGGVDPYTDLKLKRGIESGVLPGPHLDVTGAYLDGPGNQNLQMQELGGPEDALGRRPRSVSTISNTASSSIPNWTLIRSLIAARPVAAITRSNACALEVMRRID